MTPEEADEFIRGWHTMNCATMKADGTIHLVAMWYAFLEGAPALETKAKSQKVLNLRRDPRITCLIEEGDTYEELRGVELVGTGEIVEEHDRIFEIGVSIVERQSNGRPFERTPEGIDAWSRTSSASASASRSTSTRSSAGTTVSSSSDAESDPSRRSHHGRRRECTHRSPHR